MRNVHLFLTAGLGCLILAGMTMISPATIVFDFMDPERSECSSLLKGYSDSRKWPQPSTAEYARYMQCYMIICEPSPRWW
jgi:hypothetical protein